MIPKLRVEWWFALHRIVDVCSASQDLSYVYFGVLFFFFQNVSLCVFLFCFSGVPAVVDFAAMRDAVKKLGGDPEKINPICPADLVIDHSIQVDFNRR